jgi:4-aminobutyrate aminotransferase-like enzyme
VFERLVSAIPGPRTRQLLASLRAYEEPNVTYVDDNFPVVWESAEQATITDVDGNRYLDLTAAFGVANVGHANRRVVTAVGEQAARLMHAMGDVHPDRSRIRLLEALPTILPSGLRKAFLATTGSEAVEAALKTAMLYTGKPHFASFRNGYHGLSLGALPLCGFEKFRQPFAAAIGAPALYLDFIGDGNPAKPAIDEIDNVLRARNDVAALIVEPIQGRAGCLVPSPGFLPALRALCSELGIVMIVDEIFTGFGRTGTWFAVEHEDVVPDVICIGKAMGSGFPISAAVGRAEIMDAWPQSSGEALHTSTYLGNPMGCAAALATIEEVRRLQLPARARRLGADLGKRLNAMRGPIVLGLGGRGLMWGLHMRDGATAARIAKQALAKGIIVLQSGSAGETITLTPPLVITESQLHRAIDILEAVIAGPA